MSRVARIAFIVVGLVVVPAVVTAEGTLPGGGEVGFTELLIREADSDYELQLASTEEARDKYFNLAHCSCSAANAGMERDFALKLQLTGSAGAPDTAGEIWFGTSCNDDELRDQNCSRQFAFADLGDLAIGPQTTDPLSIHALIAPKDTAGICTDLEADATVWFAADGEPEDGDLDYFQSTVIAVDTVAPPLPENPVAEGGEGAIQVSWDAPTSRETDVAYYQALCARMDTGAPARSAAADPRYVTGRQLCGLNLDIALQPAEGGGSPDANTGPFDARPDAMTGPDAAPADAAPPVDAAPPPPGLATGIAQLDPAFICGDVTAPATEIRVEGLENGVAYQVAVISIDFAGNAGGVYFTQGITPQPVTDFWEDLHDRGSEVEGGFCLVAETYGGGGGLAATLRAFRDETLAATWFGRSLTRAYYGISDALAPAVRESIILRVIAFVLLAPLVVVALAWHVLGLPVLLGLVALGWWYRRRRRRGSVPVSRRRLLAAVTGVILVGMVTTASAQPSMDPYWSDPDAPDEDATAVNEPHWHVGLRVGPYTPGIDKQLGMSPGPYEEMFSGVGIMPMLDVDWLFLRRFGQLGVGGSVGFMGKSANAYEAGTTPGEDRPRSDGDETTFRLIPLAVTAVYRLTALDDNWGIPVIPYVRGGLSYYIWWIGAPSGNTAVIYPGGCDPDTDANCEGNRARGATIGFQGSIGLAIRAERIDAAAARSMREGGVEHAGFYAELSLAKVDGFGNDKKLSVGDTTWFAGVNFEF